MMSWPELFTMNPFTAVACLFHSLTHRHSYARKDGVGEIVMCGFRLSKFGEVMFKPDLDGASWHIVPGDILVDDLVGQSTPHETMALIRAHQKGRA